MKIGKFLREAGGIRGCLRRFAGSAFLKGAGLWYDGGYRIGKSGGGAGWRETENFAAT